MKNRKYLLAVLLLPLFVSFRNGTEAETKLKPGLKQVRLICNSTSNEVKICKVFTGMKDKDSVFTEIPIQMRSNRNYAFSCERGYFKKALITCQVVNCDGTSVATLIYKLSNKSPETDSEKTVEVILTK